MKLLLSTPNNLLLYDHDKRTLEVLITNAGEFYGITWDDSGDNLILTMSLVNNSDLLSIKDYVNSEVGVLAIGGEKSWGFLSQPHQILWHDGYILATNTGRNSLARYSMHDHGVRQYRFNDVLWDRIEKEGEDGYHLNSVYCKASRIYVLAHNFTKESIVFELRWPELTIESKTRVKHIAGAHNIWVNDSGQMITCNSDTGSLIDIKPGSTLWSNGFSGYIRGIAATDKKLVIGHSEKQNSRHSRTLSNSSLWIVDTENWRTSEFIELGTYGAVHDIRIIDLPDVCHHGKPLKSSAIDKFIIKFNSQNEIKKSNKLKAVQSYMNCNRTNDATVSNLNKYGWKLVVCNGQPMINQRSSLALRTEGFLIALYEMGDEQAPEVRVSADVVVPGADPTHHASLIASYRGPGDQNMLAALFQYVDDKAVCSLWINDAEWRQVCVANMEGSRDELNVRAFRAELMLNQSVVRVYADGHLILNYELVNMSTSSGSVGVRLHGSSLFIKNFRIG